MQHRVLGVLRALAIAAAPYPLVALHPQAYWEDIEFCHMCHEEGLVPLRYPAPCPLPYSVYYP